MADRDATIVAPAGLFHIEPDDGLMVRCTCCGKLKNHKRFRKDADAPRRKLCRLYYDCSTMYGITCRDFYAMYEQQDGCCAVCRDPFPGLAEMDETGRGSGPFIDHDHACNHVARGPKRCCRDCVRGLLCQQCNTLEGFIKGIQDNPLYAAVIRYQEEWKAHRNDR